MKKNNKGFSLVELIIVIAIMAILAGALAPSLIKYIAKSRRSTDVSNAQTIATAVTNALSVETAYDDATAGETYTIVSSGVQLGSGDAFCSEVTSQLGSSSFKSKYVSGKEFYFTLSSDKDSFKVYLENKDGSACELYPDVDEYFK